MTCTIVYGLAPKDATYAYSVLIQPTAEELAAAQKAPVTPFFAATGRRTSFSTVLRA